MMRKSYDITSNNKFNICDLLLLDHSYLKDCIETLENEKIDKKTKLKVGKCFVDAVKKHSLAEEKTVYTPLLSIEGLHKKIIEGEIEHKMADDKAKFLERKLSTVRSLTDELEIELKVLAEIVSHHLEEEEKFVITQMRKNLDVDILNEMGMQFLRLRKFTAKDLEDYPVLRSEISTINSLSNRLPAKFLTRIQENFMHHFSISGWKELRQP